MNYKGKCNTPLIDGCSGRGFATAWASARAEARLLEPLATAARSQRSKRICPDPGAPAAAPGPYGQGRETAKCKILLEPQPGGAFNLVNNKVEAYNLAFNRPLEGLQPYKK